MSKVSRLRQKGFNFTVRGKQALNRNRNNYPYLSGDSFASICDVNLYGMEEFSRAQIENAKSIFCQSEKLEEFLIVHGDQISAEVLVFGNTDRDFYEMNIDYPPSVKAVYLQNSHITNSFFHTLPIGIENLRYGRNGQKSLFKKSFAEKKKNGKILVGPFSPTHPERLELNHWNNVQHPRLQITTEHMRPKALATLASTFQFIACPRGNGTDTHRFWEALYRGSVPVVKRSAWSQSIDELGIPMIQLNSWDYEEFIEQSNAFNTTPVQPERISILWMEHWKRTFNSDF